MQPPEDLLSLATLSSLSPAKKKATPKGRTTLGANEEGKVAEQSQEKTPDSRQRIETEGQPNGLALI